MDNRPILSIVTPTYNRGYLLEKCFLSLTYQTNRNFEWIIVDDGSTDNTISVVESFHNTDFPIAYIRKENGGKHTALNTAHTYIHGKYVLILDSDDVLINTAVEEVCRQWERYDEEKQIAMLVFLKGVSESEPGCTVKDFEKPVDILRYRRICYTGNDCCEVIRSDLFKQYPFPVFPGERFLSEGALWNRVAQTHKCLYVNKVIYICEYLENGLTKSGRAMRIRNPIGGMYSSELCMCPDNYLIQRVKKGLLFCCYGFFAKMSAKEIMQRAKYKILTGVCLLPGYVLFCLWKMRY